MYINLAFSKWRKLKDVEEDVTITRPDLQTFTNPNPLQAQSRFTRKPEQNTTTNLSH